MELTKIKHLFAVIIILNIILLCYFLFDLPVFNFNEQFLSSDDVVVFSTSHWRNKTSKTVLLWTKYFSGDIWVQDFEYGFKRSPYNCVVTTDRTSVKTADAIVFHFLDLWSFSSLPRYRDPSQVWIIHTLEPTPRNIPALNKQIYLKTFNWTMTYRRDSTVFAPYGRLIPLTTAEKQQYHHRNYAKDKTKMAVSVISNCADNGRRYRILRELSKYISIDSYGDCGTLKCDEISDCWSQKYRFRIAFENSNCRDYVTEKFWSSLSGNVIPIVNWLKNQTPPDLPPRSFINLYDFRSIEKLGSYLDFLSRNESEYNSYFEWKKHFRVNTVRETPENLCHALHQQRPDQQITDVITWMNRDTCKLFTVKRWLSTQLERLLFDLGW